MYLLSVLILPPLGWWMLAREERLKERRRKMLIYLAAVWFGLWPFLARHQLGPLLLGLLAGVGLGLFVVVVALVWVVRRVFRRRRRPIAVRIIGGVMTGLLLVGLASGGETWLTTRTDRATIKRELERPHTFGPAHLDIVEGVPVLHLYGTPEEMGQQYGTILRPALKALNRYFQRMVSPAMLGRLREAAMAREPRLPDRYRRELKALAEASGLPYDVAVTANLTPRMRCTVLLAWGTATTDGSMVFGRNGESLVPGLHDRGSLVVVWHPNDRPAQLGVGYLGMIGMFNGINEAGLCWGNLVVFNARENALNEEGFLIWFVLREAGERYTSAGELRDHLLKEVPLAPMLVAMADAKNAYLVELSASSRGVRAPMRDYIPSGNLFLADERRRGTGQTWFRRRFDTLTAWAEKHHGKIDAQNITQALYAARAPYPFNIQTMVFEPARMKMHVSINRYPAAAGPFVELDLKALFNTPPATPVRKPKPGPLGAGE